LGLTEQGVVGGFLRTRQARIAQQDTYAAQLLHAEKSFAAGYGARTEIDETRSRPSLVGRLDDAEMTRFNDWLTPDRNPS
jgi:hypothetical protein